MDQPRSAMWCIGIPKGRRNSGCGLSQNRVRAGSEDAFGRFTDCADDFGRRSDVVDESSRLAIKHRACFWIKWRLEGVAPVCWNEPEAAITKLCFSLAPFVGETIAAHPLTDPGWPWESGYDVIDLGEHGVGAVAFYDQALVDVIYFDRFGSCQKGSS